MKEEQNAKKPSLREIEAYLNEYTVFRRMMDMDFYEKEYFGNAYIWKEKHGLPGGDAYMKSRMFWADWVLVHLDFLFQWETLM